MFDQPYSPSQLAEIGTECGHVPLTARGWNAFFAKHNIEGKQRSGRGGGKVYAIDVLPTHLRLQLSRMLPKLGHEITDRTQAKIAILHGFKQFLNVTHLKTSQGRAVFCDLYNARCFPPSTLPTGVIKHLSPRSLFSWVKALEGNTSALRDDRRGRARPSVIDIANGGAVRDYVVGLIATSQFYTSGQIRDCLRAQFGKTLDVDGKRVPLPTDRAIRRFVARWRAANARDLMAVENPDAWKNKYQLAIGDQNAGITRPNQRWEIDASPVDALTIDGRYQLYCLIDIYTRRMRVLISKTPRTTAALELIRQCIMEWGVPEAIRTDNGSDFTSKHFKIAMDCLGIMHDVVPPFSPEKKGTVERAIGTLQRDIIRLLPGFVGHSVKDRKMIEGRKAFATRLGENAEAVFCVNMRAEEIQDTLSAWCAGTYEKRPHSSLLARRSPHAIYASANFTPRTLDAEALHILLAPIDGNGLRTVTKKGIRIGAASYFGDALIAFVGEQVLVRMNTEDLGKVYCFDPETYDFIGEAQNLELLGAERELLAASAKRKQAAARAQARKHLRKLARPITQSDIVAAALDAGRDYGCIMQRQKLRLQFRIRELRISNLTHEFHDKSLKLFVAKCLRRTNRFLDGFDQAQSLVSHFDDAISRVNQCSQIIEVNHSKLAPDYNSVVKDNS